MRVPEQPRFTLMLTPSATIVAVRQEHADEKLTQGWLVVARESDMLPFNAPRLVIDPSEESAGDGA